MVRALAPFLPGQTLAQEPQPVQSSTETVMANFMPGMPVISATLVPAGALGGLLLGHHNRTDDSVRANIRAEVTLNTIIRIPNRYVDRDTAFLISRGALWEGTVLSAFKGRYGQLVAMLMGRGD